jgi:hypothetical protein
MVSAAWSKSVSNVWAYRDQTGMATAVGLLITAMLTLLGATAALFTSTDILIGGQYKTSNHTFYSAEAGAEEARARLRLNAGSALIADAYPTSTQWRAYIGSMAQAQSKGYNSSLSTHLRRDSFQGSLDYVATIRHKTNGAGQILYWGDDNGDGVSTENLTGTSTSSRVPGTQALLAGRSRSRRAGFPILPSQEPCTLRPIPPFKAVVRTSLAPMPVAAMTSQVFEPRLPQAMLSKMAAPTSSERLPFPIIRPILIFRQSLNP